MQSLTVEEVSWVSGGCSDGTTAMAVVGTTVAYRAVQARAPQIMGWLFAAGVTALGQPELAEGAYAAGMIVGADVQAAMADGDVLAGAIAAATYVACKIEDKVNDSH